MAKTIFMQTTEVEAGRSAAEITSLLVQAGARQIATDYAESGKVSGIRFSLPVAGVDCTFSLPARTDPVFKMLLKQKPWANARTNLGVSEYEQRIRELAERIGWRQLYRWTQAQLAFIESGQATTQEVFFPYLVDRSGRTVFAVFEEQKFKMLTAGTGE